jgi:hypothetical protein
VNDSARAIRGARASDHVTSTSRIR